MWILPLVGYLGIGVGFCFLTLSIASGLYYLSELTEEYTVLAQKLLTRLIYATITILSLLWLIDSLPLPLSVFSIFSHLIYLQNLRRFPIVKLAGPTFIASCILVLLNHFFWFRHFSASKPTVRYATYDEYRSTPSFTEVASFFGICVWLTPFALFISLSAGENVLPSMGSEYATGEGSSFARGGKELGGAGKRGGAGSGMAKAIVDGLLQWVGEAGQVMGLWRGDNTRRLREV